MTAVRSFPPHPPSTRRAEMLAKAAELTRRYGAAAHVLEIEHAEGIRAQHYDPEGNGRRVVVWCDVHQADIEDCRRRCHQHDRLLTVCHDLSLNCYGNVCLGVPLELHTDTTGDQACNGTRKHRHLEDLEADLDRAVLALVREYRAVAGVALGDVQPWSDHQTRASLGGDCVACGRYVSGSANDRLRSGLCDRDRKHWDRHRTEHVDRAAWLIDRRKHYADNPPVQHVDPTNKYGLQASGSTATIQSVEVRIEVACVYWAIMGWCRT